MLEKTAIVIRKAIDAYGACSFATLHNKARHQVVGCHSLSESHRTCKEAIAHLISLGILFEQNDEFGIVYGYESDID